MLHPSFVLWIAYAFYNFCAVLEMLLNVTKYRVKVEGEGVGVRGSQPPPKFLIAH